MGKKYTINVISDSAFTVQGHGVHTAYTEHLNGLKKYSPQFEVHTNQKGFKADITHIHTVGYYGLRFLLGKHGLRFVSAHVVPESFVGSFRAARLWLPLARWYLRWFYNHADGVFAVSQDVAVELKEMHVKTPVYVVPNMLDGSEFANSPTKRLAARNKLGLKSSDFVVVCSGQVQPRKRVDSFLACAKAMPDIRFIWVGGIPFRYAAADYHAMHHIMLHAPNNVRFTGVLSHQEVVPYFQAADLFFLPSEQETFGIVAVEASAAGLPILLRDYHQYKITFKDSYLAAKTDRGFIDIITKLAHDRNYYLNAQRRSRKIIQKYEAHNIMKQIKKIYLNRLEKNQ